MDGIRSTTGATSAAILRAMEANTEKSVVLLKKALQADKSLVETLLPAPSSSAAPPAGRLDIRA